MERFDPGARGVEEEGLDVVGVAAEEADFAGARQREAEEGEEPGC